MSFVFQRAKPGAGSARITGKAKLRQRMAARAQDVCLQVLQSDASYTAAQEKAVKKILEENAYGLYYHNVSEPLNYPAAKAAKETLKIFFIQKEFVQSH